VATTSGGPGCGAAGPTPTSIFVAEASSEAGGGQYGPQIPLPSDPTHLSGSLSGSQYLGGSDTFSWQLSWDLHLVNSPDSDSDGISDYLEKVKYGTDPTNQDTDGDGYLDGEEIAAGTNPLDPNSHPNG
jgi:hypothetical protein